MLTGNTGGLIEKAYCFAKAAHDAVGQVRKYTGEPYFTHPVAVAGIVSTVTHSEVMLAAALLHDTVEDTGVDLQEIEYQFGSNVAELIGWLTKVSRKEDGNRAMRNLIDLQHIAAAPAAAKTIKLADLIDNCKSIVSRDPKFAKVYLYEKAELLQVLLDGDASLWDQASKIILGGIEELDHQLSTDSQDQAVEK